MTHVERLKHITEWAARISASSAQVDTLIEHLGLTPEAPVVDTIHDLQDGYTAAVARLIGDQPLQSSWLDWYWLDNRMGTAGLTAKSSKETSPHLVPSLAALAKLIADDCDEGKE
jgi:hypothetical protein